MMLELLDISTTATTANNKTNPDLDITLYIKMNQNGSWIHM